MATFDVSPLFRSATVGFDQTWPGLGTAFHLDTAGFPAYNILRTGDEEFRISLAVPGFTGDEVSVEYREGALWVKGEHKVDADHNQYLYRGIPTQAFQRNFQLPEHVKVSRARLEAGMLHVDLVRELPEALRPRRIEIQNDNQSARTLTDASKQAA